MSKKVSRNQLSLWEEPETTIPIVHHHMEWHYQGGGQVIVCTASPEYREKLKRPGCIYSGFVGGTVEEECTLCHPR